MSRPRPPLPGLRPPERRRGGGWLLTALVLIALIAGVWWLLTGPALGRSAAGPAAAATAGGASANPPSGLRWVSLAALPLEVHDTMAEIQAGPPYRYPASDGVVYHNNNGILPMRADGYYHEFTVVTPGANDRGARRIIAGGPNRGLTNSEWYYTLDHYNSFERIRP